MIESTFVLLNGIGEYTERKLWAGGVNNWRSFLGLSSVPGVSRARKPLHDEDLRAATESLSIGNARYFSSCLKLRDHWRLFETFGSRAVYLDIETTGAPPASGEVTVVGLYAHDKMTTLVRGETLSQRRLQEELRPYDLVVTFFGSVFDVPYLRAKFPGLIIDQPHLDLCFAARRLGFRGGLKHIEQEFGIERASDLEGLSGWDAVRLWEAWKRGHHPSRERLLRYNEADVRNLAPLAVTLCDLLAQQCRAKVDALLT